MKASTIILEVEGTSVEISCLTKEGTLPPLVCLHGFGSTKEDYADLALWPEFADRSLVFWDAPGCGASRIEEPSRLSIPFLVTLVKTLCDYLGLGQFHLSGHSMGGLTGLMFAHEHPDRVLSFIDIEGNVAPEDCFLSRQIVQHPAKSPEGFMDGFIDRVRARPEFSSGLYVAALKQKVQATTFEPIFKSMVDISDTQPLMDMIGGLACPRTFIYGEQNRHLSYLGDLPARGVNVVEIPHSAHFPMYSNPPRLWSEMAAFLARCEAQDASI